MVTLRQAYEDSAANAKNPISAVRCEFTGAVAFYDAEKFIVSGFKGKRAVKADLYTRCGNAEAAKQRAEEFIKQQGEEFSAKHAYTNKQENIFSSGDILVSRWGCDQTNVDFYEVIKATPKSIRIRKLKTEKSYSDAMHGKCIPMQGQYADDEEMMRRVIDDYVFINTYAIARKFKEAAILPTGTKIYNGQSWSATA